MRKEGCFREGKNNGTDKCRTHKGKKLMLGVCTLVFLGVLLTGCFALGYKGVEIGRASCRERV